MVNLLSSKQVLWVQIPLFIVLYRHIDYMYKYQYQGKIKKTITLKLLLKKDLISDNLNIYGNQILTALFFLTMLTKQKADFLKLPKQMKFNKNKINNLNSFTHYTKGFMYGAYVNLNKTNTSF